MKKGNRTAISIFIGTLTAIAITFLVALFVSAWVLNGKLQEKTVKYYIMVGQFLACLIGFILTGKITKEKVAIHISASAGVYTLILAVISIVIIDADFMFRWGVLISIILSIFLSCAICIRNQKTNRFKKWQTR